MAPRASCPGETRLHVEAFRGLSARAAGLRAVIDTTLEFHAALGAPATWVLAFDRGGVACMANLSASQVKLPRHTAFLLPSGPLPGGLLPPDTAAWLRIPPRP